MNFDNTDILWQGTYFGLNRTLSDRAKSVLKSESAEDLLYDSLSDPNRFVAGHVLLCSLHQAALNGIEFNAAAWGGLNVVLEGNGNCVIDPSQMDRIKQFWFDHREKKLRRSQNS